MDLERALGAWIMLFGVALALVGLFYVASITVHHVYHRVAHGVECEHVFNYREVESYRAHVQRMEEIRNGCKGEDGSQ